MGAEGLGSRLGVSPVWQPRIGQLVGHGVLRPAYRLTVKGANLVPRTGPVILVANHTGFLDGPFVFTVSPRPVHFLVKQETFSGLFGLVLHGVGQIPVDRTVGDRTALGRARAVLGAGGVVGLFPEGTRGRGDVSEVHQGATWLALASGAPIVPVACLGTRYAGQGRNALPRPGSRLVAVFGEPVTLTVDRRLPGRDRLRAATESLRVSLANHVRTSTELAGLGLPDALRDHDHDPEPNDP